MKSTEYLPSDPAELAAFVAGQPLVLDVDAHREGMLQHYQSLAALDLGYARWCCGMLSRQHRETHGDLLKRFDAWLLEQGLKRPEPFADWMKKMEQGNAS